MNATALDSSPRGLTRRGPIALLLRLFSSIWLGIVLLTLLFIYASVGSSGVPVSIAILKPESWVSVREIFELSEFEWFHWWPFDLLVVLICLNIVTATLRRIPFGVLNLGVWMIHTGILVLAAGSLWYFGTKVEGDTPVTRRTIVASVPGHEPVSLLALPGNTATVGSGPDAYELTVSNITPDWELLSGDDAGDRAYKVSVLVRGPGDMFIRELLAGYPQYTEDLVRSNDPAQPFARAKKVNPDGSPIVDGTLALALEYAPQDEFFLMESEALYLRPVQPIAGEHVHGPGDRHCPECGAPLPAAGEGPWRKRTIDGLPRYKDYVAHHEHVWFPNDDERPPLRPLDVRVEAAGDDDPLADRSFVITDHLRYASIRSQLRPGGDRLYPFADVRLRNAAGETQQFELFAFDPQRSRVGGGLLEFRWITSEQDVGDIGAPRPPLLAIQVPGNGAVLEFPIDAVAGEDEDFPFTPVEGTPFSFRVRSAQDGLVVREQSVSLAIVEIDDGTRRWVRWVFQDPALSRDVRGDETLSAHSDDQALDDRIRMRYRSGRASGLVLAAGPGETDLRLFVPDAQGTMTTMNLRPGVPVVLRPEDGVEFTVMSLVPRPRNETRPMIVPEAQRQREVGVQSSMIRLAVPSGGGSRTAWLPFHVYPFERPSEKLRRFPYSPTVMHLDDGRHIELLFSRDRMQLPVPVALDEFAVVSHIGGFTGQTSSILDWQSVVRFRDPDAAGGSGGWSEPEMVKVNGPTENNGFWFFQSQWDPPDRQARFEGDPGSNGLNYTVLGVGNRNGVLVQLAGCCIAVIGMIYAFYVKPYIKRRRQLEVHERVATGRLAGAAERNGQGRAAAAVGVGTGARFEETDR